MLAYRQMTTRAFLILACGFAVALGSCTNSEPPPPPPDSCTAVADHFVHLALQRDEPEAVSLRPMLGKLRGHLISRCTKQKWTKDDRQCFLRATTAVAADSCIPD